MTQRPPLTADTPDGFASAVYLWLILGFILTLFVELAVLGFDGLVDASPGLILAFPLAAGGCCMAVVRSLNRVFGSRGIVVASWAGGGMYSGFFVAGYILKHLAAWQFSLPVILGGMAAGLMIGLLVGRWRILRGDNRVWMFR